MTSKRVMTEYFSPSRKKFSQKIPASYLNTIPLMKRKRIVNQSQIGFVGKIVNKCHIIAELCTQDRKARQTTTEIAYLTPG